MSRLIPYSTDGSCPYCQSAVIDEILVPRTLDHDTVVCGGCLELYNYRDEITDEDIARADRFLEAFQKLNRPSKVRIL